MLHVLLQRYTRYCDVAAVRGVTSYDVAAACGATSCGAAATRGAATLRCCSSLQCCDVATLQQLAVL
ncbi:unnamed protein product [Sphagnum troendelagicum]|uniref:Uncharacterized protein n=1 Tax=Sphagnum troendelagicum TaxID=128251 RepID=A0ABP0TZT0_9BRYO